MIEWATSHNGRRTLSFSSRAQAQHFIDEALTALEYLGCTILEWWAPEPTQAVPTLRVAT